MYCIRYGRYTRLCCSNDKSRYVAAATLSLASTGTAADETSVVVAAETVAAAHVQAEAHFAAAEAAEKKMIDEMRTQAQAQLDAEILDDDEIGEEGVSEAQLHSALVSSFSDDESSNDNASSSRAAAVSGIKVTNADGTTYVFYKGHEPNPCDGGTSQIHGYHSFSKEDVRKKLGVDKVYFEWQGEFAPRALPPAACLRNGSELEATAETTTFWSGKNQLYPRNSEGSGPPPGPPSGPPAAGPPLSGPPPEPQQQTESVDEEEPLENAAKLEGLTELVRRSKAAVSTLPPGPSPPPQGPAPTPRGGPRPPSALRTAPPQAVQAEPSNVETTGGKGNGTEEAEEGTTTPTMKSIVKKVIPPGPTLFDHFLAMATLYQPPPPPSEPVSVVTSVFIGQKSSACLYVV